jgi:hypothetical protein
MRPSNAMAWTTTVMVVSTKRRAATELRAQPRRLEAGRSKAE